MEASMWQAYADRQRRAEVRTSPGWSTLPTCSLHKTLESFWTWHRMIALAYMPWIGLGVPRVAKHGVAWKHTLSGWQDPIFAAAYILLYRFYCSWISTWNLSHIGIYPFISYTYLQLSAFRYFAFELWPALHLGWMFVAMRYCLPSPHFRPQQGWFPTCAWQMAPSSYVVIQPMNSCHLPSQFGFSF